MTNIDSLDLIMKEIHFVSEKYKLIEHPFFSKILTGTIKRDSLAIKFSPFFFAVENWVHHLQNFVNKIEYHEKNANKESLKLIKENIDDECGIIEGVRYPEKAHTVTFINFLHALGFCNELKINQAVKKFNTELENSTNNVALHACILGGIEHFYIAISAFISKHIESYLLFKQEHYSTHEEVDQKHSMDFFRVAFNEGATMNQIQIGIGKGYQLLWDVFEEMDKE